MVSLQIMRKKIDDVYCKYIFTEDIGAFIVLLMIFYNVEMVGFKKVLHFRNKKVGPGGF